MKRVVGRILGEPIATQAAGWADYDNDGRLELWVNPNRASLSEVISDHARERMQNPTISMCPDTSQSDLFTCARLGSLLESTIAVFPFLIDPISCATER